MRGNFNVYACLVHVAYEFAIRRIIRKREKDVFTYIFIFESVVFLQALATLTAKLFNCILTLDQVM